MTISSTGSRMEHRQSAKMGIVYRTQEGYCLAMLAANWTLVRRDGRGFLAIVPDDLADGLVADCVDIIEFDESEPLGTFLDRLAQSDNGILASLFETAERASLRAA